MILFYIIRVHEILAILIIFKKMEGELPMAPLPQPPAFQSLVPVAYSQPLPQPQAAYGRYAPVPQQAVVTIVGSGATSLSPNNNCVICMSVFVCLFFCTSMGIVALVLALVARVFREDTSNAVKAVTLNRYAFRWTIAAIIAGIVIIVLRFIVRFFYHNLYQFIYILDRGFSTGTFMDAVSLPSWYI